MHQLGSTRSTSRQGYLLQTPDTFVRTPSPDLQGGTAIVHAVPEMGAGFAMRTVLLEPGGAVHTSPVQQFLYVLEGDFTLAEPRSLEPHLLSQGGFAYLPVDGAYTLETASGGRAVLIGKPFQSLHPTHADSFEPPRTELLVGHETDVPSTALTGDEDVQVRSLLPPSMAFDFAVNTMSYAPGASLGQVEVHYMEHGLLMLDGAGIYRLGEDWHPVQAGDFIWMAPFCPQWFGALGKVPARYLIYKNFNRPPYTG